VGAIYGLMLAVWGFSSLPGPLLMASLRQSTGSYSVVLYLLAGVMLVSALLPLVLRPPRPLAATEPTPDTPAPTPQTA
jgi:OFA family oxalate/formate antiporter-like MFS transporter